MRTDSRMVRAHVFMRISRNIHFNEITGAVKEIPAIFTQMPQVQLHAQLQKISRHLKKAAEDHHWKQVGDSVVGKQSKHNNPVVPEAPEIMPGCPPTQISPVTKQTRRTNQPEEGLQYERRKPDGNSRDNVRSWRTTGT